MQWRSDRGIFIRMAGLVLALLMALGLSGCNDNSETPAPSISVQPADTSATIGTAARLSVTASGSDVAYQWQVSADAGSTWTDIAGATAAVYTTPATTLADDGKRYRVVVTAAGISVTSSAVTLTVTPAVVAPAITAAPASVSVIAPTAAVFHVTATGTAVTYQWQRSVNGGTTWANVDGATDASLDSGATDPTQDGIRYRVIVSNAAGSVTSDAATLSVSPAPAAPAFVAQPADQSVAAGAAAAFSATTTGAPTPTLQWQRSTDGGSTWADIAGATSATFNTGTTTLSQDGERYRVVASNGSGTATSNAARLSVSAAPQAPAITAQPADQSVTAPATASFTASASGVPTPTWQWQLSTDGGGSWANLTGATSATYTTPATVTGDSGKRYRAVATNGSGSATTAAALLTVSAAVTGPQWGTASTLQNINHTGQLKIAAGANGEFVVVWIETGSPWTLRSQRYLPGSGWAAATSIDTTGATPTGEFDVGMNPNGTTATVVWTNGATAWATQSDSDGQWSPTQALPAGGNYNGAFYPRVTMDATGSATAAWVQTNNPSPGVFLYTVVATVFPGPSNPVWSAPVVISSPTDSPFGPLMMKGNANGDVVAAWVGNNAYASGSRYQETLANVYHPATGWDGPTALTDASTATLGYLTDVAINANGVAAVAYNFTATAAGSVQRAQIARNSAGVWSAPTDPAAVSAGTLTGYARIALDNTGLLTAIWVQAGNPNQAWAARETVPGNWGSATQFTAAGEPLGVVADANGNALAVWDEGSALNVLKSAWLPAGASQWTVLSGLPGADPSPYAGSTTMAVAGNGDIVAAWLDGVTYQAWGNRLH